MKLRNIREAAPTQAELDKQANDQRQEQIKQMLDAASKKFSSSNIAQLLQDSKQAFNDILNIARNETTIISEDTNLQNALSDIIIKGLNQKASQISNTGADWTQLNSTAMANTVATFKKLQLENKTIESIIHEGVLNTLGSIFTKVIGFLIKTTAAGLAAGASFGLALAGNRSGGYGGYGGSSRGSQARGQGTVDTKYKIALFNAKFVDFYLGQVEPGAAKILQDPAIKTAIGIP